MRQILNISVRSIVPCAAKIDSFFSVAVAAVYLFALQDYKLLSWLHEVSLLPCAFPFSKFVFPFKYCVKYSSNAYQFFVKI